MTRVWLRILLLCVIAGCTASGTHGLRVLQVGMTSLGMTPTRVALLTPDTSDVTVANAYARLHAQTARLLREWLGVRVVERGDLRTVQAEQRWQYAHAADESSLISAGRLLGADTIMIYRITEPPLRARLFTPPGQGLPPVTITAKLLQVETGEELWSYVVTVEATQTDDEDVSPFASGGVVSLALTRGVDEMLAALGLAIACEQIHCAESEGWHQDRGNPSGRSVEPAIATRPPSR